MTFHGDGISLSGTFNEPLLAEMRAQKKAVSLTSLFPIAVATQNL